MSINFPIIPALPSLPQLPSIPGLSIPGLPSVQSVTALAGLPSLDSFPGTASIVGSIQGQVLSVTQNFGVLQQGLSLSGLGVAAGTTLTSGLTSITQDAIGNVIGQATVNISQTVGSIAMSLSGSVSDLVGSVSDVLGGDSIDASEVDGNGPKWGIFLDGSPVIVPDSFVALEHKRDWHIADYPVEEGQFESYNKVRTPGEQRVTLTRGGTESDRTTFLEVIDTIADSLDLYDIVTPEQTYRNANVTHYDYRRGATNGVSLLTVSIWFQEIRVEASSTFTNTAQPGAASQVNGGAVQAVPAPAPVVKEFQGNGASGSW